MKTKLVAFALVATLFAGTAAADSKPPTPAARAAATLKQIEATFGFVPQFVRVMPAAVLPTWWDGVVAFSMSPTSLDGKTKELIGLAVAAQVPCEYCVYYHTEAAKLNGATEEQIREAVAMAAVTRNDSTLLNGLQIDKAQFKRDIARIFRAAKQTAAKPAKR